MEKNWEIIKLIQKDLIIIIYNFNVREKDDLLQEINLKLYNLEILELLYKNNNHLKYIKTMIKNYLINKFNNKNKKKNLIYNVKYLNEMNIDIDTDKNIYYKYNQEING